MWRSIATWLLRGLFKIEYRDIKYTSRKPQPPPSPQPPYMRTGMGVRYNSGLFKPFDNSWAISDPTASDDNHSWLRVHPPGTT